jgi:hypothetical protein
MSRATVLLFGLVASFAAASRLEAGTITLDAIDSGWYNNLGGNNPGSNYFIGSASGRLHRDFFVFDLSGISETIIGAELRLFGGTGGPTPIRFWSVDTTPIADLMSGTTGVSIYIDLGNSTKYGTDFGNFVAQPIIVNSFALNATALTDLESAKGGLWAVGGRSALPGDLGAIFGNTDGDVVRQLVITTESAAAVPEPASLVLALGGGLCALGIAGIRRGAPKHPR